jgi:CO/xanthine dehydrogenase Mo-binding subunit
MGLSIGIKDGGGTANHAQALVKVLPSGRAIVNAAAVEIDQGATTALSRIAAETLKLALDWVRYGAIDTDHTPLDNGTHASCGTAVTGIAVMVPQRTCAPRSSNSLPSGSAAPRRAPPR